MLCLTRRSIVHFFMRKIKIVVLLLSCTLLCVGCASSRAKEKELLEIQQKNYQALLEALETDSLSKGMTPKEIKDAYGKPADIFSSGSMSGTFEIWTYELLILKGGQTAQPIRLYFTDNRLIHWSY